MVKVLDAGSVVRSFCVFLMAVVVVGTAIAVEGWCAKSLAIGGMMVLTGGLVTMQIRRAIRGLHHHSHKITQAAREAEKHYIDVLRRIVRLVEAGDRYTTGHSERVGVLAEKLARRVGLPKHERALMKLAGELHDIGMLAVPAKISAERCRIGVDEFRIITKHSEAGYEVLKPLTSLESILPATLYHHERMNGTGYPEGLIGDQIPLAARVLAVADSYDAMTHDRPHRPAMTTLTAMQELKRCTPAGYDPQVVDALAEILGLPALTEAVAASG